jgi:hypothetical protein
LNNISRLFIEQRLRPHYFNIMGELASSGDLKVNLPLPHWIAWNEATYHARNFIIGARLLQVSRRVLREL